MSSNVAAIFVAKYVCVHIRVVIECPRSQMVCSAGWGDK